MRRRVKANHSTRACRHYIALDTETHDSPQSDGSTLHRLWFGAAISFTVEGGRAMRQQRFEFDDAGTFWQWLYSRLTPKHTTWLVSHFAAYDLTAVRLWREMETDRLIPRRGRTQPPSNDDEEEGDDGPPGLIVLNDPPTILDLQHYRGARLVCVDLMNWLPMPLSEIASSLGSPHLPLPGDAGTPEQWKEKCRADAAIVRDAVVALVQWVREYDLGVMRYTASGQSMNAWRHGRMDCAVTTGHEGASKRLERASYYPGTLAVRFLGRAVLPSCEWWGAAAGADQAVPQLPAAPVYRLDANACYPHVMHGADFPTKLLNWHPEMTPGRLSSWLDIHEGVARVVVDSPQEAYPVRIDRKAVVRTGRFETVLCGPELRAALQKGHITRVCEFYSHQRGVPFSSFVEHTDSMRERYRAQGNKALVRASKTLANALHGKFGQWGGGWRLVDRLPLPFDWGTHVELDGDTGKYVNYRALGKAVQRDDGLVEKKDNYPLIAAYTAAYARLHMREACEVAGDREVFYQDVDSIHVSQKGYSRLESLGWIHPTQRGALKVEEVADFARWYGPKYYDLGGKLTRAGLSPHAVRDAEGQMHQRHFTRLVGIINGTPPEGPVTREVPFAGDVPKIDGMIRSDGWVDPLPFKR